MSFINCKISLVLTWSENCLTDIITHAAVDPQGDNPARSATEAPAGVIFKVTNTKLFDPAVTLSTEDHNKLLEQLETGF